MLSSSIVFIGFRLSLSSLHEHDSRKVTIGQTMDASKGCALIKIQYNFNQNRLVSLGRMTLSL